MRAEAAHRLGTLAIVVAHPDDEVIGAGGQLLRWATAWNVIIVNVTDGAPAGLQDARAAGFSCQSAYAAARRGELDAALASLPSRPPVVRLGAVDRRVSEEIEPILGELARLMGRLRPDIIVTHAYEGGHPDHDALAFAIQRLRANAGRRAFRHLELAGYHERAGGGLTTNRFPESPACESMRIRLTPEERRAKRRMLGCFESQCVTLAPFLCHEEWLRVAPDYDFSRPPNDGRIWYEYFGWGLRQEDWRARMAAVPASGWRSAC
jgi:LmbE family N-acetylglucosaminyl deacetylase